MKLKNEIKWVPKINIDEGIKTLLWKLIKLCFLFVSSQFQKELNFKLIIFFEKFRKIKFKKRNRIMFTY